MYTSEPPLYGSSTWADMDEIAEDFPYNPETDFFLGRNPFNYDEAIGVPPSMDGHILITAGTGGGKGRSFLINNILQWRGSIVVDDPKGENASIAAARRANGDPFCDGLGQETYVLDPYGVTQVPDELRASCNLLSILDPSSGSLLSECQILAEEMRMIEPGAESESWSKAGARITALIMAHVVTWDKLPDDQRNLSTVREFITVGLYEAAERIKARNRTEFRTAKEEGRKPNLKEESSPHELLFQSIRRNMAQRGALARTAAGILSLMETNLRQYGSLMQNAEQETAFLDDLAMVEQQEGNQSGRHLNIADLQDSENGISVFLTLPDNPAHPAVRWKKSLLAVMLNHMQMKQGDPPTGKVLMVLDEFASNGKMDRIANGLNSIRGAGVKLCIVVTQLGDLKETYKEAWSKFPEGCSTQIYFEINGATTGKYIESIVGDVEVRSLQRSASFARTKGQGTSDTSGESFGETETEQHGTSDTQSQSESRSRSDGHNQSMTFSEGDNWSDTEGTGSSRTKGRQSGWALNVNQSQGGNRGYSSGSGRTNNYADLFDNTVQSTNLNRNSGRSRGTNWGSSRGKTTSGGFNEANTISANQSSTKGGNRSSSQAAGTSTSFTEGYQSGSSSTLSKSYSRARNRSTSRSPTTSTNTSITRTSGVSESVQKRPLITIDEMRVWLGRVDVQDDPTYPGFALVILSRQRPFLVRKSYYDQDALFERCFTPHYAYRDKFLPKSQQRLVGGEYTPEHFVPIRLPARVRETAQRIDVDLHVLTDQWFEAGDTLFTWEGPHIDDNREALREASQPFPNISPQNFDLQKKAMHLGELTVEDRVGEPVNRTSNALAPYAGKVIDYALPPAFKEDGDIMLVRFERRFSDRERQEFEMEMFFDLIEYLRVRGAAQSEIDAIIKSLNDHYQNDWDTYWANKKKQKESEAEQIRAARAAEEQRKKENFDRHRRLVASIFLLFVIIIACLGINWTSGRILSAWLNNALVTLGSDISEQVKNTRIDYPYTDMDRPILITDAESYAQSRSLDKELFLDNEYCRSLPIWNDQIETLFRIQREIAEQDGTFNYQSTPSENECPAIQSLHQEELARAIEVAEQAAAEQQQKRDAWDAERERIDMQRSAESARIRSEISERTIRGRQELVLFHNDMKRYISIFLVLIGATSFWIIRRRL